ncbi:class Ib ribonucleoside-diphosphate reductase assembly flavoprotein NrdI [Corynebacterium pygosceleis]|nr:class Ib ribonucleoside-diphosphate reductase assembly flavoprotein NrdI [Corynebacterium pygosceleis]MCK7637773.1 class Ib ribonucleoside-diphosphate reductase assembly flavoprotein NrdI [Corynebacterium pygosceleis]MCK7674965.1 class Ib ribonucleoside-diphosphate reductase assembly flavoprotein NrdI [Corynebacterium pygosceleis]MCL0119446.1 class Ib ribonucleoside-diphosphate reductase assembly flavoprotein NrdI [Corynebacterium pygosceleis]MCX7444687.1 class Ib ribonucleoside-diphosphate 
MSEPHIVYFSSVSGNTARFVDKLGISAERIPLRPKESPLEVTEPFVLIVPTYGGGSRAKAVPRQVIRFLNNPDNRALLRGVITSGNTNFGEAFCCAGPIIAAKCGVPELYRFELLGTTRDVERVRSGLIDFFNDLPADRVSVDG